jgi:mRNA interferase MazF
MKQYEVWCARLPQPIGTRPVLLLSRDSAYEYLNRVIAVEVTSRIRGIPQEVAMDSREGLPQRCVANLDNLRAVPKGALEKKAGRLSPQRIGEVKRSLGHTLGWIELSMG